MLIAGPNLTIDRTSAIDALRPGEVLRLEDVAVTPGGKGLNVARAGLALGAPGLLVAFLPGHTGRAAAAMIAQEGVTLEGIPVAGEIRSTSVILERGGRATVLNEPGPLLALDHWAALEAAVAAALPAHGVLVCSGSLPPGSPEDGYARLVRLARDAGRATVVDTSGPALQAATLARPDVVAPNLAEAETLLYGRAAEAVDAAPDARPRAEAAAIALVRAGAGAALVTAAAAGAAVATRAGHPLAREPERDGRDEQVAWIAAPHVTVRNPIGAGDVLTAAVALALEAGEDMLAAARRGVAAAAASVESPCAGHLDPARMAELLV